MNLLVGIDRSDRARPVLEAAIEHARAHGVDLTVAVLESENSEIEQLEGDVRGYLSELSSDADVRSLPGHAGSQLVELAEREAFDQLIIDGGETSPLGKIRIKDLTEFVLLNATTTVTLVR